MCSFSVEMRVVIVSGTKAGIETCCNAKQKPNLKTKNVSYALWMNECRYIVCNMYNNSDTQKRTGTEKKMGDAKITRDKVNLRTIRIAQDFSSSVSWLIYGSAGDSWSCNAADEAVSVANISLLKCYCSIFQTIRNKCILQESSCLVRILRALFLPYFHLCVL